MTDLRSPDGPPGCDVSRFAVFAPADHGIRFQHPATDPAPHARLSISALYLNDAAVEAVPSMVFVEYRFDLTGRAIALAPVHADNPNGYPIRPSTRSTWQVSISKFRRYLDIPPPRLDSR